MAKEEEFVSSGDPVEDALNQINAGHKEEEETQEEKAVENAEKTQDEETPATSDEESTEETDEESTEEAEEEEIPSEFDISSLDDEQKLEVAKALTGLDFESLDDIKKYTDTYGKLPELQKNMELFPKLVEKLKESKNVLTHFPDETAYKVAQVIKNNEAYKGKETVIDNIMRKDLSQMKDLDVLRLSAQLQAPDGVRNPLRSKIKSMGLDPDDVLNDYGELSDDDKDTIAMAAGTARRELQGIGNDIELPGSPDDILSELENELSASNDELQARKEEIAPIAKNITDEITELPVTDDFDFKLDFTAEEKDKYSEFITDAVLSGEFDLSTEKGQEELYGVLMDEIYLDNKSKILEAYGNRIRESIEAEMQEKYNNEKPLDKKEPPAEEQETKSNPVVDLLQGMVDERL